MSCPSCRHENPPGSKFCEECGEPQPIPCPSCGHLTRPGAKFCSECGFKLDAPSGVKPAPPPEAPTGEHTLSLTSGSDSLAAERRQLTVMFCDLVGSTKLSNRLDPEDLRNVVQSYQAAAAEEIRRFDGYIAQYLGDGLLVYFGYPTAFEDAAHRAIRSGLGIVDAMERLNRRLMEEQGQDVELEVRIGVHTGLVVIGDVGAGGRHERLAMGDTPNLAARVQEKAEPGGVLISAATMNLVKDGFQTEDLGPLDLKGFGKPMHLFKVLGDAAHEELEARMSAHSAELVGRSKEKIQLLKRWSTVKQGRGHAVLLHGEAGIGKSRLVHTLRVAVGSEADRLELRASQVFRQSPLHPFIDLFERSAGISPFDQDESKAQKLERLASRRGFEPGEALKILAPLLSVALPESFGEVPSGPELRELTQAFLVSWVLKTEKPILMVFEDLHWLDPSSAEVLQKLAEKITESPVMMLGTSRDVTPPWGDSEPSDFSVIGIGRLSAKQVEALIHQVAGRDLPPALISLLSSRADGIPVFVEELTRMVIETGLADQAHDTSQSVRQLSIPVTLQDSLLARLDRLGNAKVVVQIASALGRDFDYELLRDVAKLPDNQKLNEALGRLEDAEILYAEGEPPNARYIFRHALLQDAAYSSLLRSHRLELHRIIGQLLEKRFEKADAAARFSLADLLAYHWANAVDDRKIKAKPVTKAVRYSTAAGEEHLRRSAYIEARTRLTDSLRLIDLLPESRSKDELELQVRLHLGNIYKTTIGWVAQEVLDTGERARELCLRLGDRPELSPVLYGLWQFHLVCGDFVRALELAEECHTLATRLGDSDILLGALIALANTQFWLGDLKAASANAKNMLQLYDHEAHGHHLMTYGQDPRVMASMFFVWSEQLLGRLALAEEGHQRLNSVVEEIGHLYSTACALNVTCSYYLDLRDSSATFRAGDRMAEISRDAGFPHWEMVAGLYSAWAKAHNDAGEQAWQEAQQGYLLWPQVIGGMGRTFAARLFAEVCLLAGKYEEGLEAIEGALTVADEAGERVYLAELLRLQGILKWQTDSAASLDVLERAFEVALDQDQSVFALRVAVDLAAPIHLSDDDGARLAAKRIQECLARINGGDQSPDVRSARGRLNELRNTYPLESLLYEETESG